MGTAEVVNILSGCEGCFLSRFIRGKNMCGWVSGTVAFVLANEHKVVMYLERKSRWDKELPVEVPVHLINGSRVRDDGRQVHLVVGEDDITLTREPRA